MAKMTKKEKVEILSEKIIELEKWMDEQKWPAQLKDQMIETIKDNLKARSTRKTESIKYFILIILILRIKLKTPQSAG